MIAMVALRYGIYRVEKLKATGQTHVSDACCCDAREKARVAEERGGGWHVDGREVGW